jgi:hygromycin-B 7''-O-kinase
MPRITNIEAFHAWRADLSRCLPAALDIARSHGLPHNNPHLFSTGTNLVVALDDMLVVKIFPPLLRHQFTSERMLRGPPPAVLGSLNRLKDWNNARQFA